MPVPAGDIHDTEHPVRYRIAYRRRCTRELAQLPHEVLAAADERGSPSFESSTYAVSACEFLGVAVPGREGNRVQRLREGPFRDRPFHNHAIGRGKDDCHGLCRQVVGDPLQDGRGSLRQS